MARREQAIVAADSGEVARQDITPPAQSKALGIAERGVESSSDFRNLMSALMTDVIRGSVSPEVTNAACNAGGKLLKMVELEYKYATEPHAKNRTMSVAGRLAEVNA